MRIRLSRSIIPNLFTVLNIFFGFLCIINAMEGRFLLAGIYIFCSAICDTLDGFMARLTRSASEFGVELDSLADVVSFGAAPSVLLHALFLHAYGPLGMLVASSQLVFGALRLARFNVQLVGFSKDYFVGVPIPLSALTLVSYIIWFGPEAIIADTMLQHVFIGVVISCGLLMVSTIRYPVLPKPSLRYFREKPFSVVVVLGGLAVLIVTKGRGLLFIFGGVVLSGVLLALWRLLRRPRVRRLEPHDEADSSDPFPIDS